MNYSVRMICVFFIKQLVADNCNGFQFTRIHSAANLHPAQEEEKSEFEGVAFANKGLFRTDTVQKRPALVIHANGDHGEKDSANAGCPATAPHENTPSQSSRCATRNRWGIDNSRPEEYFEVDKYWFNARIHTLGNTGLGGGLHAAVAPFATVLIDKFAYRGMDVREMVSKKLYDQVHISGAHILDLCCGVGMSTRALRRAFCDAEEVIGVDTSPEMIEMAKVVSKHDDIVGKHDDIVGILVTAARERAKDFFDNLYATFTKAAHQCKAAFVRENAEHTGFPDKSFDIVTIMYAFHEAPRDGRERILGEGRRLLREGGTLALVDISPDYKPSLSMLWGEPYVLEYLESISSQMENVPGFTEPSYETIVPGHVGMWRLTRQA